MSLLRKKPSTLVLSIFCLMQSMPIVHAADIKTTAWPMYQQNAAHTGFLDVTLDPSVFKFDWKIKLGHDNADTSIDLNLYGPVVSDDAVYVTNHGTSSDYMHPTNTIQKIAISDGHEIWYKSFNQNMTTSAGQPGIFGNEVYVEISDNIHSDTGIYSLDATSGNIVYQLPITNSDQHYLSPTFYKGNVFPNGSGDGGVYSIKKINKHINWFTQFYDNGFITTPAVNNQYVVSFGNNQLNILDAETGTTLGTISDPNANTSWGSSVESPVLADPNTAIFSNGGYLTSYNLSSRTINWSIGQPLNYGGQPSVDEKYIYMRNVGKLNVINKTTGEVIWTWKKAGEFVGDQIIVTDNLVFVETQQAIYAISKETHKAVWSYKTESMMSAMCMGMGHLYVAQSSGDLVSFSVA